MYGGVQLLGEPLAGVPPDVTDKVGNQEQALALVRDGDRIRLDAAARKIDLLVEEAELTRRRAQWKPPEKPARGYGRLYVERVTQADKGCDFDFLAGT